MFPFVFLLNPHATRESGLVESCDDIFCTCHRHPNSGRHALDLSLGESVVAMTFLQFTSLSCTVQVPVFLARFMNSSALDFQHASSLLPTFALKTHCCSESEAELSCLRRPGPRGADPGGLEVSAFQKLSLGALRPQSWRFLLGLGVFRPPTRTIPSGSLAVCDTSSFGQRSSGGMLPSSLVQDRNHHERRIRELYGTIVS